MYNQFLIWLMCWAQAISGTIGVLTFGFWRPGLDWRMSVWYVRYRIKKRIQNNHLPKP